MKFAGSGVNFFYQRSKRGIAARNKWLVHGNVYFLFKNEDDWAYSNNKMRRMNKHDHIIMCIQITSPIPSIMEKYDTGM